MRCHFPQSQKKESRKESKKKKKKNNNKKKEMTSHSCSAGKAEGICWLPSPHLPMGECE